MRLSEPTLVTTRPAERGNTAVNPPVLKKKKKHTDADADMTASSSNTVYLKLALSFQSEIPWGVNTKVKM